MGCQTSKPVDPIGSFKPVGPTVASSDKLTSSSGSSRTCSHLYCEKWGDKFHCCDCNVFVEDPTLIAEEQSKIDKIIDNSNPEDGVYRGVTIGFLMDFAKKHDCYHMSTREVRRQLIMPATREERCRYVELPEMVKHTGKAVTFISHTWGAKFGDLVAAVCDGDADRNRIVWVDIFAVRQWPSLKPDLDFSAVVKQCKALMIVCSSHDVITNISAADRYSKGIMAIPFDVRVQIAFLRVWCLVEIHEGLMSGNPVILKGGNYSLDNGRVRFDNDGKMMGELARLVDVEAAEATVESDKTRILDSIRASVGVSAVNEAIRGVISGSQASGGQPVIQCAACGDESALKQVRANPTSYIKSVAGCGYFQLLQELIDLGADVNIYTGGLTPITAAAYGGHAECIELLIKAGCIKTSVCGNQEFNALMCACFRGYAGCVELLLRHGGFDIDAKNKVGHTALMCAAQGGHMNCIQLLVKAGVNINLVSNGFNALMHSAKTGHADCVEYFLNLECDYTVKNNDGGTALLLAAQFGFINCVDLLLKRGADIGDKSKSGQTALHLAAIYGHAACIEMLLQRGCDPNVRSNTGWTALETARKKGFKECVAILEKVTD